MAGLAGMTDTPGVVSYCQGKVEVLVASQDFEVSVTWTRGCDYIPQECNYTLQCVKHVTAVEVCGVEVPTVPSSIVAVDSGGMILLYSWA